MRADRQRARIQHRHQERASDEKLAAEREREKEMIREIYVGSEKAKKRVIPKPSQRFRFSFDWENVEDTSRDADALYQNPHEARLLFGRGFIAGVDRREQKKRRLSEDAVPDSFNMPMDHHWKDKSLEEMTERDWRIFQEDQDISFKGSRAPRPLRSWTESELTPELLRAVERAGYKTPTPIQMAAIPLSLQQRDMIGVAETGCGKTAAFVLPMLSYIARLPAMPEENKSEGPYAVVLAPTRELAQQIEDEIMKLARYLRIKVVSIIGGWSIEEQGLRIARACEVVIATPGRLLDCLERRYAVLNQCHYVVLDEADRMIDMGMEQQVTRVLSAMPSSNRTTHMFSATMPPAVERLARRYLRDPVVVTVGAAGKATDRVAQRVFVVKESEKLPRLRKLLEELGDDGTAIVFCNTRHSVDQRAKDLGRLGFRVTTLRGGKTQEQRDVGLEEFRSRRSNVLVATDVGIDVPNVAHVINYDMPERIDAYVHRIGRTGRAGKTGVATTLLTSADSDTFFDLKNMLAQSNCPVPPELHRATSEQSRRKYIP